MNKKVTNLIEQIGKCRDLIKEGNYKKIIANINLFTKVYIDINRNINKYTNDPKYELDFTYYDIMDLSNEIADFLKFFPNKFRTQKFIDKISKNKKIDDRILNNFCTDLCDLFYIDNKLRETQKILAYSGFIYFIWSANNEKNKFDFTIELTNTIKSFL